MKKRGKGRRHGNATPMFVNEPGKVAKAKKRTSKAKRAERIAKRRARIAAIIARTKAARAEMAVIAHGADMSDYAEIPAVVWGTKAVAKIVPLEKKRKRKKRVVAPLGHAAPATAEFMIKMRGEAA